MIVGARQEAASAEALSIGWYAESFARTKRLKPLAKLLEPELPPQKKAAAGASKVGALFRQIQHKQKGKTNGAG
jgi:hypothetical protein